MSTLKYQSDLSIQSTTAPFLGLNLSRSLFRFCVGQSFSQLKHNFVCRFFQWVRRLFSAATFVSTLAHSLQLDSPFVYLNCRY